MIKLKRIVNLGSKYIDYKMGFWGAGVMGGIVFSINYFATNEITGSLTAATKQGTYTFLFGGILMKGCEHLATKINKQTLALLAAVIIPSTVTLILTYAMHSLKGTPKPFESTIPTTIIIPATAIWGYMKRKQMIKNEILEKGTESYN